jgi:iron complex outermembrane receptor protein
MALRKLRELRDAAQSNSFAPLLAAKIRQGSRALLSALLLGPLLQPLHAQDTTVVPLPQIEVTVTRMAEPLARVPAAVSIVQRIDIQRAQPGIGMEESLAFVPGLIVNNRYNFALGPRISIRGYGARAAFGVRGIRVLADGVPLTMPDGQANLNNIDLTSTARIEVLRGAASMFYGNAAGGVVAFQSEVPQPGFGAQMRVLAGSDDLWRGNVKAGGGSADTRYLVSFARLDADGFRAHSAVEQNNLNARVRHQFNERAFLAVTLNAADAPTALNPGSLPLDSASVRPEMAWPRNAATRSGEAARQIQLGLEHGHDFGPLRAHVIAYGLTRELENPLPFAYIRLDRQAGGVRSSLSAGRPHWRLTGGVDVEFQSDDREELDNVNGEAGSNRTRDQTDRISNIGPFIRLSADPTAAITVAGGLRYDRTTFDVEDRFLADTRDDSGTRTMSALSPMAGVTYRISDVVTAFAGISTAFQTPTTTELINNPVATGLNELEPQRSVSYELGMRLLRDRWSVEASAYHTRLRDALVPYQIAGGDGREFFRNAGRTRQRGLEAAAHVQLTDDVAFATSYTWNDFVFIDDGLPGAAFEGHQLPGVAPHHWTVRGAWSPGAVFVELEVEHTSRFYAADSNEAASRNPAATVVDMRGGGTLRLGGSRWEPFIGLNNLLDEKYFGSVVINAAGGRYFEPAPGRNIYLGLGVAIGNWH